MAFQKGQSGNPNGREKGKPTKSTARFKEALNAMLEKSADDMILWLGEIDDPKQRFDVLKDFAEYIYPKLARTEQRYVDEDGKDKEMSVILNRIVYNAADRDK